MLARVDAAGGFRAQLETGLKLSALVPGSSIACSGACLTVTEIKDQLFTVDVSPETVRCTNLSAWQPGSRVNLEPAMKAGDALDGHIVTGHVDGLARLVSAMAEGNSWKVTIEVPDTLQKFVAEKGSVTLDGVSLTVNKARDPLIELMIIPHTWQHTVFQFYQPGALLNLEIDILARYVARLHAKGGA